MSQEKFRTVGDHEESFGNPYFTFVHMESLSEKLKLLNYEQQFCRTRSQKPLSRHYYAIPTNPGEQFHNFTSLASWLVVKANGKIDPPQEYDDPNATIATILDAVRELGHSVEFPPSKLKSGCGEYCIEVLRALAESALRVQGHRFESPKYPEEDEDELDIDDADFSNVDGDIAEWQGQSNGGRCAGNRLVAVDGDRSPLDGTYAEEEEEDEVPDLEALKNRTRFQRTTSAHDVRKQSPKLDDRSLLSQSTTVSDDGIIACMQGVLESKTDPTDWQLEVERVLPQLRVTIRSDAKDWRSHLEEMRRYQSEIEIAYTDVKTHLARLGEDLSRALEKIHSREKYMNSQIEPLLAQYKSIQSNLSEVSLKYRMASGGITERSHMLAELSEELERVKNEMDERGSSMTDGSPVVRIKQAIQRLKAEMLGMDIRTGVLEHILLRTHLRVREDSQKSLFSRDGASVVAETAAFVY
ncbi:Intraflagellar transport protein 57 [Clonorchis sinensis]|uniref:Intraflagellar transport protein 57 n=1 Tax=Clonorchis sinensis TaxID=79923 RepID=A0A419Q7E5_CLOSI|nr:Intraflagellar transport protein 57 [Clonorchis sinensis]